MYYKLNTYIRRQLAQEIVKISQEKQISVWDAAQQCEGVDGYVKGSIRSIQTHMQHLLEEPPVRAIHRITQFMGYQDYLNRSEIKDTKLDTLRILAAMEDTPVRLVERLQELRQIMETKEQDPACPLIMSTIHASKGLEYDTVCLLDVIDGILPDQIPKSLKNAPKEDIEAYEEDRRLFYVGVTRAKNRLLVFTMKNQPSKFCMELLGKEPEKKNTGATVAMGKFQQLNTRPEPPKNISEEDYQAFVQQLDEGVIVTHKKFGKGVVVQMDETKVKIAFEKETKVFVIRVLAASGMVEV